MANSNPNKEQLPKYDSIEWYFKVLKQYADFSGRARRKEYWMFVLFNAIISIGIMTTIAGILSVLRIVAGIIFILYVFAVFMPALAVMVRRLHDVGKSGWMLLITLIPLVGTVWLLVLLATDSEPGNNQYGANPKGINKQTFSTSGNTQPRMNNSMEKSGKKVSSPHYPPYTGTGLCDVCNCSLGGVRAYIVPNNVFYNSGKYRAYVKNSRMMHFAGMTVDDAYFANMQALDKSAGSAVCENCIYMFR